MVVEGRSDGGNAATAPMKVGRMWVLGFEGKIFPMKTLKFSFKVSKFERILPHFVEISGPYMKLDRIK